MVRGLDFDETEHVLVPADQINFSMMPRRAEIARDHDVAAATKVEVGVFLAATAGAKVGGTEITGPLAYCDPIQDAGEAWVGRPQNIRE